MGSWTSPWTLWGRRMQLVAGLLLFVSPFLSWARVEVLSLPVGVPGLFLTGGVLLAVALTASIAVLVGARIPGFQLAGAAVSAAALYRAGTQITERTEYVLARMQLSLADFNAMLAKLGVDPVELYQRQESGTAYLGPGLWVGCVGAGLLALGAFLETAGRVRFGLKPWSVWLGRPRCTGCNQRVEDTMKFCPGCGRSMGQGRPCPECRTVMKTEHQFCSACGAKAKAREVGGLTSQEVAD